MGAGKHSKAKRLPAQRLRLKLVLGATCVAAAALVIALLPAHHTALDEAQSLADTEIHGLVNLHPASQESESLEQFASVLHVNSSAAGQEAVDALLALPESSYAGYLFQADSAIDGAAHARLVQAAENGTISQVHGATYSCDSLTTLAGIVDATALTYVEPNYAVTLVGDVDEGTGTLTTRTGGTPQNPAPDYPVTDPYPSDSPWNLDMLNVKGAWELGLDGDPYVYGGKALRDTPVKVAVIDSGLYGTGASEPQHEDIDYTHVIAGKNYATTASGTPDTKGHGTFVSGLIFAKANNGVGIAGMAPGVQIVPVKVFGNSDASTSDVVKAIYYAVDEAQVDVINMSLGGEGDASSLREACDYAAAHGVLVVAAAGNDGVSTPNYPAAYDSVVGVASVNKNGIRSSWSQYGTSVFVSAPGENVTSTYIDSASSYRTASGTSFSSPEVAALAALCKSVYPDITQDVFKEFLIDTSVDYGAPGYDDFYGWGLVDFGALASHVVDSQTLSWYDISFDVKGEDGAAISNAQVTLTAAEDISWDADASAHLDAGSIAAGTVIEPEADGSFRVHRGSYRYVVVADGHYRVEGEFKTYSANQTIPVTMETAYQVNLSIVDEAGAALEGATVEITSTAGRVEQPLSTVGSTRSYALASGTYAYVAHAAGRANQSGSFTVQRSDATLELALYAESSLASVGFSATDRDDGSAIANPTVIVMNASGMTIDPGTGGTFRLARGASYEAIVAKLGYEDTRLPFTVGAQASQTIATTLVRAECQVTFNVIDGNGTAVKNPTVAVTNAAGAAQNPSQTDALRYNLKGGSYRYRVTADGYQAAEASFYLSIESRTITVILRGEEQAVSFAAHDATTGAALDDISVKVSTARSQAACPAQPDGSYLLEPGSYRYTVFKSGYRAAYGSFDVPGSSAIDVELTAASSSADGFADGDGSAERPYLIATEAQLRHLAEQTQIVRNGGDAAKVTGVVGKGTYYLLVDDIELTDEWLPIGNYESTSNYLAFAGHFDGGGHVVSGLRTSDASLDAQGLFGYIRGANISNVTVEGSVAGDEYVAGIAGYVGYEGTALSDDWATGSNIIANCVNRASVNGRFAVGGIVGDSQRGVSSTSGETGVYGTVIRQCANVGAISAGGNRVGGIAGYAQLMSISYSYNQAPVTGLNYVGGIAGSLSGQSRMANCYNSGAVNFTTTNSALAVYNGALVGQLSVSEVARCHGLTQDGQNVSTIVGNSDATSEIAATAMHPRSEMFRSDEFVALLNVDAESEAVTATFVKGGDYPYLRWEARAQGPLAERPQVGTHPQGNLAGDAYDQGSTAAALTAAADAVSDGGNLTWQWYASADASGADASPVAGAAGSGARASFVPPTANRGVTYYFVRFTNTVTIEGKTAMASADSKPAGIAVRSNVKAQAPTLTALNPSQNQQFNYQVRAKQMTELELTVTATSPDGGALSYQWYEAPSRQGTGSPIAGATDASYTVPTDQLGTAYYYVMVTNTVEYGNATSLASDWIQADVVSYTISSFEELASFRSLVNEGTSFAGCTVTLTEDIAIPADQANWEPIGTSDHPFMGVFMGGTGTEYADNPTSHKITGLAIDGDSQGNYCLGLFGAVSAPGFIYGVEVQGSITGANNWCTGLLVGSCLTDKSGAAGIVANCATLPGSSVEGKYQIGGLIGYGGVSCIECANHADVHARPYDPRQGEPNLGGNGLYRYRLVAVGGIVGVAGTGTVAGCYNTGTITVDAPGAGQHCAIYVGGLAGSVSAYSSMASCFNTGAVNIGTLSPSDNTPGVRYAGALAGYVAYANFVNLHYLDGSYKQAVQTESGNDYSESHSLAFLKTPFFLTQMNDGSYAKNFVPSKGGLPRLAFETDLSVDDGTHEAAEPYLFDIEMDGEDDFIERLSAYRYQNEPAPTVKVSAISPENGTLTYQWQRRAAGASDDAWQNIAGQSGTFSDGAAYYALPTDAEGSWEYRCVMTNTVATATDRPSRELATPAISFEVRSASAVIGLRDASKPNGYDNPWVIASAEQLAFFSDLVNRKTKLSTLEDPTFMGQYVSLEADVDLSAYANWSPIGNGTYHFEGCFDGNGHSITGLTIAQTASDKEADCTYKGLFGSTYYPALIRNLTVSGTVTVNNLSAWNTGGVVGYAYASQIVNVASNVDVTGTDVVGGVVARAISSQVVDCENRGDIGLCAPAVSSERKGTYLGGIVGYADNGARYQGSGVFTSFNSGMISGKITQNEHKFGSLVGCRPNAIDFPVNHCYYLDGTVTCLNDASRSLGAIGSRLSRAEADVAGDTTLLSSGDSPATAWALNTADETATHSKRWGNFALAGEDAATVHLVMDDSDQAVYRIDGDSAAASFQLTAAGSAIDGYCRAGQTVVVNWKDKPGYTVKSVAYQVGDGAPVAVAKGASFTMPAADVRLVVSYEQQAGHRFAVSTAVTQQGNAASAEIAELTIDASSAVAGQELSFTTKIASGYQQKSLTVTGSDGKTVTMTQTGANAYSFVMPGCDVTVSLDVEPLGTPAASRAASLPVTTSAVHVRSNDARYKTGTLLYDTITFSGSAFGEERYFMANELEQFSSPALYEQEYSFADGSTHRFTGYALIDVIERLGATVENGTAILIESADGTQYRTNGAELRSLAFNAYDAYGNPTTRGLPAMLAFGSDGTPNTDGSVSVVFGQNAPGDDNVLISHVTRIAVGVDINYAQHVYAPYDNPSNIGGAHDVVIRIYRGNSLLRETSFSYADIEAMARADRAGIQHGNYTTRVYEDDEEKWSGPFTDYYEGYDLYKILREAGVPYQPGAKVQFYQTAEFGLDRSWKTVNVSLGYLAGNGPAGAGDYSQNVVYYGREEGATTGGVPIWGVRPMIAYGKNGLPLVYNRGALGVGAYNYRGPLLAILPQNMTEGGKYVGVDTASSCYLGLIDVYLDAYAPIDEASVSTRDKTLAPLLVSGDGEDRAQTVSTDVITQSDGAISVESSNPSVATASYDAATGKLSVTAVKAGSCVVRVRAAASANYPATEVYELPVNVAQLDFKGGSLRTDVFKGDGTPDDGIASLRLGYAIHAPQGVDGLEWHWSFAVDGDPDASGYSCPGRNFTTDGDGNLVTNIVFTNIGAGNYGRTFSARLVVTGTDAEGHSFTWSDDVRSRSVSQVAAAAAADAGASDAVRMAARFVLGEFAGASGAGDDIQTKEE